MAEELITAPVARLDSLTPADIALAGTVGKDKLPSQQHPQRPILTILTVTVSFCGSALYAYGRAMSPIGFIPSLLIAAISVTFTVTSAYMINKATNFEMPFDLAVGSVVGRFPAILGNCVAIVTLCGTLMAYCILLTDLWQVVVYRWFLPVEASFWAGLITTACVAFIMTTFITQTSLLIKIGSYSFISIICALVALVYYSATNTTAASAQCALDVLKHPSHAPAFSGSTLHAVGNLFAIVGVFNSSFFIHNSYETYFVAHPTPNKRFAHLVFAHVLGSLVHFITGFAVILPNACTPSIIPPNSAALLSGPLGIIAQLLFLLQLTTSFAIVTSIVRSATVERLPWRRAAEGGNFGWASFVRMFSRQRPRNAIQIVNEFVDDGTHTVAPTTDAAEAARAAAEAVRGGGLDDLPELQLSPAAEAAGGSCGRLSSDTELTTESDKEDAGAFELGAEMPLEVMVDVADPDAAAALRVAAAEVDANAEVRPPFVLVLGANIVIIGLCVLITALKVTITTILSYFGSIAGWIYMYTLPPLYWVQRWRKEGALPWGKVTACGIMMVFGLVCVIGTFIPK